MAVIPKGYVLFSGTEKRPEAFIHKTMHVCVEYASNAPPSIQKMFKIQLIVISNYTWREMKTLMTLQVPREQNPLDDR